MFTCYKVMKLCKPHEPVTEGMVSVGDKVTLNSHTLLQACLQLVSVCVLGTCSRSEAMKFWRTVWTNFARNLLKTQLRHIINWINDTHPYPYCRQSTSKFSDRTTHFKRQECVENKTGSIKFPMSKTEKSAEKVRTLKYSNLNIILRVINSN